MRRLIAAALLAVCGAVAGCSGLLAGPHPFVDEGDADSVTIGYSGDVARSLPLARKHCAQFERVPRLAVRGADKATYDCVKP